MTCPHDIQYPLPGVRFSVKTKAGAHWRPCHPVSPSGIDLLIKKIRHIGEWRPLRVVDLVDEAGGADLDRCRCA